MTPKVEEIKEALRACTKVPEVNSCALHYAAEVAAMEADPEMRVMAIQIKNLAAWRRRQILESEKLRNSPHSDPQANGTRFGEVIVTVDREAGDCEVRAPQPGKIGRVEKTMRLHSLEEIQRAYEVQLGLSASDPIARDIAKALKFAGQQLQES